MKTLIVFSGKYGATRRCAEKIASCLKGETRVAEIGKDEIPSLCEYDLILLGSSVYMGRMRREMRIFAARHEDELLKKKLGLFLCCIQDLEQPLRAQLESGFSKALLSHAVSARGLGGTVNFSLLSRFDRFIMNLVLGRRRAAAGKDVDTLSDERIRAFAKDVSRA